MVVVDAILAIVSQRSFFRIPHCLAPHMFFVHYCWVGGEHPNTYTSLDSKRNQPPTKKPTHLLTHGIHVLYGIFPYVDNKSMPNVNITYMDPMGNKPKKNGFSVSLPRWARMPLTMAVRDFSKTLGKQHACWFTDPNLLEVD